MSLWSAPGSRWRRLGLIYCPSGEQPWLTSHAANPFVSRVADDRLRVYFSSRDAAARSYVAYVDLTWPDLQVSGVADRPVLTPGGAGLYDDSGCSLGCIVEVNGIRYLYYVGWNLATTVPFRNSIGLAIASCDGPFVRAQAAPVLDRNPIDPYSLSYPWVLRNRDRWWMWYGSNLNWGRGTRDMEHVIKLATSSDGRHWTPTGSTCIDVNGDDDYAMSRPCVVRDGDEYRMWYSARGRDYRIAAAVSKDGITWTATPELGLAASGEGWDSDSVAYAHVFVHAGRPLMAYCGNGYGRTGFGFAAWEPSE